ncbi:MAG: RES family NAD+ phosphorylase [Ilumatobacteraceae bacterium]
MTFDPHLLDAIEKCGVDAPLGGTVWRQILEPTSVLRPNILGARWNPPGVEALYCSLDPETAAAEIDHLINSQPIPITRERQTHAINVRLSRVVDIRDCAHYDFDFHDLVECEEVGAAVSWLGYGGLLVPSLRGAADNLVIYVAQIEPDDHVEASAPHYVYPPGPPAGLAWTPLSANH